MHTTTDYYLIGVENKNGAFRYAADTDWNHQPRFVVFNFAKQFETKEEAAKWWEENKAKFAKYMEKTADEYHWDYGVSIVKYRIQECTVKSFD